MPPAQDLRQSDVLSTFLYLATATLAITILARGEPVLVPIALAVLLTFILTPLVKLLERQRVPRAVAAIIAMLGTLAIFAAFGWVLTRQVNALATDVPQYSATIRRKLASLRANGEGTIDSIQKTVDEVSKELDKQEAQKRRQAAGPDAGKGVQPVLVVPQQPTIFEWLRGLAPSVSPLATLGVVLVLTLFMLVQREDLRNRVIRLVGRGRVTLTTRTLDEAGQRISRYLVTQSLINAGFGTAIAAGLTALGIEYALLWGVTAALLRFVPYVGSLIAMAMPMALAFVQYDGWAKTVETLALFLALEATTANVVEPLIIGRHTGVSALALLVTALFWTWLWGPLGLVLSTPLTVCLAVLGKHVPQLEFLAVLLGDEEPLEADVTFYQRLLARDEDEAADIVEERLGTTPPDEVFDGVVVPALVLAGRDRARDEISDADHQWVLKAANEIVQQVVEAAPAPPPGATAGRVLGVPVRHAGDELLLTLLCHVLDGPSCGVEQVSSATLASEVIETIERDAPDLVCLAALPPGGVNHLRYLCKRIRARTPDLKILVVRPGVRDTDPLVQRLTEVGADAVVGTLAAARDAVARLLLSAPAARAETTSRLAGETRA